MGMNIVIQQRRKALGLTQEQVAKHLGVTTPAVNKWERGSTCPDIALLSPLARLLEIDLNTLLCFQEDISPQDMVQLCREISACILSKGFEAGYEMAQSKIHEYPNSDRLLHTLALQLQLSLSTSGLDADWVKKTMHTIKSWYERLALSSDAVIRNSALFMLASDAIGNKQYEEAQKYLDEMNNRCDTPDKRMLQATIYLQQDQKTEALKLLESALLSTVADIQVILYRLIDANLAAGDREAAVYVATRASHLAEVFDLNPSSAAVASLQVHVANQDVEHSISQLRKLLSVVSCAWTPPSSPLYGHIPIGNPPAGMEKLVSALLKELKQSPAYAYLHDTKEFRQLLSEFETIESEP